MAQGESPMADCQPSGSCRTSPAATKSLGFLFPVKMDHTAKLSIVSIVTGSGTMRGGYCVTWGSSQGPTLQGELRG